MVVNDVMQEFLAQDPTMSNALASALPVPMVEPVDISNAIVWRCPTTRATSPASRCPSTPASPTRSEVVLAGTVGMPLPSDAGCLINLTASTTKYRSDGPQRAA